MLKLQIQIVLLGTLLLQPVFSSEIDSVTPRKLPLQNSLAAINGIINRRIEEGIRNANAQQESPCEVDTLYTELRQALFQSLTASWGLKGYDLDLQLRRLLVRQSYALPLQDSIYRDINILEGFSLNLKELSDVINIDGYLIGLDKIGHFFDQGWQYFALTQDGKALKTAIEWGQQKEAGLFGYTTTGIYSYADLVANFNGWRFWNRVRLKQLDPLSGPLGNFPMRPYAVCRFQLFESIRRLTIIRRWQSAARFDLADYIDAAWDEGNNCNSYADPTIADKISTRIQQVDPGFVCPLHPGQCATARNSYGPYASELLHPDCLTAN